MNDIKLEVLSPNNPALRTPATALLVKDLKSTAVQSTIEQLLDFVYGHNNKGSKREQERPMTVGLSAPQVGINWRISVVDLAIGFKHYSDIHVLINPVIIRHSAATITRREGCVNFSRIWGQVERYRSVTVQALDRSANKLALELTGWPAALLQHEIDHLNGRLFIDHLVDPTKAHLIEPKHFKEYNKKTALNWPYLIDVSKFVKP